MWWLLLVAPVLGVILFVLTGAKDKRRDIEIAAWRRRASNARKVMSLPGPLARVVTAAGGGTAVGYYEVAPKLAFVACMGADALAGSEHVTVAAKLDEPGPTFCVRPLAVLEGERVANTGVEFTKDEEFMDLFLVERTLDGEPPSTIDKSRDKAIRKWLSPVVREALLDAPDLWLRVDGKARTMALTRYGLMDADKMDALVEIADVIFAEYGAGGGPSLLPEGAGAEREADEREEEDDDEDDEEEAPPPPKPAVKSGKSGGKGAKA